MYITDLLLLNYKVTNRGALNVMVAIIKGNVNKYLKGVLNNKCLRSALNNKCLRGLDDRVLRFLNDRAIVKFEVYYCEGGATDSVPLLIAFVVNSPRGANTVTDSVGI